MSKELTIAPALSNFSATSNPILTLPPVTRATLPARSTLAFRFSQLKFPQNKHNYTTDKHKKLNTPYPIIKMML